MAAGEIRAFDATGNQLQLQGGVNSANGCGIPPVTFSDTRHRAEAIVVNLVAVAAAGPGDLRVFAGSDAVAPLASVINYVGGQTIAVGTTIPLRTDTTGDDFKIQADVSGTHVVVDVLGYYSRAPITTFTSRLRGIPAAPAGNAATHNGPITGPSFVTTGIDEHAVRVDPTCRAQKLRVFQTAASPPAGGIRLYLLRSGNNTLLSCGVTANNNLCTSDSSDPLVGNEQLYVQTFNQGIVPSTDALVSFELVCE